MIPIDVTIATWTGTEAGPTGPSHEEYRERLWAYLDANHPDIGPRFEAKDPEARRIVREAGLDYMFGFFIAHAHRTAAPLANELADVSAQALAAVRQAGNEYADLSKNTTVNWLAAHHRFVLTTQNARALLERRIRIAQAVLEQKRHLYDGEPSATIYAKFVPAEHRIVMPDLEQLKAQLANFVETSTERFTVTRVTITGGYPAGFAPAPLDTDGPRPADDDEVRWINTTFPSSYEANPAVVAGARNW